MLDRPIMPNTTPSRSGKKHLDAQTYRARLQFMGKKTANKRSNNVPQDLGNDTMTPMSCEPSYKRQRMGLATQQLEKAMQMDKQFIIEEDKVGTNESGVDESHDQSASVLQDSSKSPSADSINLRFAEYWIPVQLTDIQVEQYCSTIITNTKLLCSKKKRNLDLLQGVLGDLRKCCDHPYVLDSSLQKFRKECCPSVDYLNIGIQASGKLQLLSKLLPKFREQRLRVLIVYKTASSSVKNGHGIGYILDDFICQSFGHESYVHIYTQRYVPPKEKQAAADLFNDRTSGRFVVLAEYSSYPVSIGLKSLDAVILFNSDLNPSIDIRSLQKMSLHADNGPLRVLRLYSLFTVEEKALCMARESSVVRRNRQFMSKSTCEKLVSWGTTCLFEKLDEIHASHTSESDKALEYGFLCSVIHELSAIFSSNVDYSSVSCSVISKVNEVGEGCYGNIKLQGELPLQSCDGVPPHVIWSSLLQGRIPCWRFLPNEPGSFKKRISFWERPPEMSTGLLHEEIPSWHRDSNLNVKRSKRVRGCILGFQQKLQVVKRLWYMKVDKPRRKRKLEEKNVEEIEHFQTTYHSQKSLDNMHLEKELLISEICGASYRELGRFKLNNGIQLGGECNDMDNRLEDPYPAHLTPMNNEEEIDAPSTSIDSRVLNTSESAIGNFEQPIQKLSGGDELNTTNGNNLLRYVEVSTESLPTEISSTCQALEEVTLKNNQPISDDHALIGSGQSTSNQFVLQEDLDIFDECLPTKEMIVAVGSDSENIYVRPVTVPVAELFDPIPLEDLIASECILNEDDNHAPQNAVFGSLSVTENEGPVTGMQSSEELAIQSDTINPDTLYEETLLDNEQIELQQSIDPDTLYEETLLDNEQIELQQSIDPDTLYEETFLDNELIELQQSIDQIHQLPSEQLPPTPLPCSDFSVTVPLPSCEIDQNDAYSPPFKSPTRGSPRLDTFGQFGSTVRGFEGDVQPLLSDSYTNEYPNNHQPANLDPLESEQERIENVGSVETKKHEDTVLQLKAACEKEMAQIYHKYSLLHQNAQKDFIQKKEELKMCYEKTKAHKALANAWKLATDENFPISIPAPPVQINGAQMMYMQPPFQLPPANWFSNLVPNQTVLPPYPPSFQNPYLYPSPLTQTYQLHRYHVSQPNQHPPNIRSSALSAATAYPQLYSPLEYLAHYNTHI